MLCFEVPLWMFFTSPIVGADACSRNIVPTKPVLLQQRLSYNVYQYQVVEEIGSGVNDSHPKFLSLLEDQSISLIVVEHKDRGTRFGFRYIETLLKAQGREIEVVN